MLYSFSKGGIHPPENKLSANNKILDLQVPASVIIPLGQHLGTPAKPIVNKGDVIKAGQLIATGEGFVSSNVHSSVSGKVIKIDDVIDVSGYKKPAIFIAVEGDQWIDAIDRTLVLNKTISLAGEEIIKKIADSGIVGLGGATFPTQVKLSVPRGKKAEYLIINGVECEPYLTSDHALMMEKGEEIMVGIQILKKALNAEKAIVGIENNKPDAIRSIKGTGKKIYRNCRLCA